MSSYVLLVWLSQTYLLWDESTYLKNETNNLKVKQERWRQSICYRISLFAFLIYLASWHRLHKKLYAFQCRSDLRAYVRNKSLRLSFPRQETDSVALWPDVKVLSWHKRLATHRHCLSIISIHPRLQQRCVFSLLNCALSWWKTNSSSPFKFLLCKQKKQFSLSEHK